MAELILDHAITVTLVPRGRPREHVVVVGWGNDYRRYAHYWATGVGERALEPPGRDHPGHRSDLPRARRCHVPGPEHDAPRIVHLRLRSPGGMHLQSWWRAPAGGDAGDDVRTVRACARAAAKRAPSLRDAVDLLHAALGAGGGWRHVPASELTVMGNYPRFLPARVAAMEAFFERAFGEHWSHMRAALDGDETAAEALFGSGGALADPSDDDATAAAQVMRIVHAQGAHEGAGSAKDREHGDV